MLPHMFIKCSHQITVCHCARQALFQWRLCCCRPAGLSPSPALGDTVSKCPSMSVQGKSTVRMSEGGGQSAPGLWCSMPGITVGHSSWSEAPQKVEGAATITPSLGCLGNTLSGKAVGRNLPHGVSCSLGSFVKASRSFMRNRVSPCLLQAIIHAQKNPVAGECCKGGWLWSFSPSGLTPGLLTELQ